MRRKSQIWGRSEFELEYIKIGVLGWLFTKGSDEFVFGD